MTVCCVVCVVCVVVCCVCDFGRGLAGTALARRPNKLVHAGKRVFRRQQVRHLMAIDSQQV